MRQSIILPNKFEAIFLNEAEKSGLIKQLYSPPDDLFPEQQLLENQAFYKSLLNSQKDEQQKIFRMLMLFDNVILPSVADTYNFDRLLNTGLFSLFFLEDYLEYDPIHQDGHAEYARHLKPAILPVYEREIKSCFQVGQPVGGFQNFVSDLYDWALLGNKLPQKHEHFLQINRTDFNRRHQPAFHRLRAKYSNLPDVMMEKGRFYSNISTQLRVLYESLCWELKISSEKDAAIMDCEFQLADIGCESYSDDITQAMEAYSLLRVECGKMIGTLPQVNSMQEVFRLKEKRRHDLHNLRQELSRLEDEIRKGNSQKAIEKAAADITKASKALSRGNIVSKVTKWTNFFSIPIGLASLFFGQPQIAIGAGVLSVIGQTSTFAETTIKDRNKWFEIII